MTPWIPMFGIVSGFASMVVIAWVIFIIVDGFRRREQVRANAEFQARLLERISSTPEFGEFLNTSMGGRFLSSLSAANDQGASLRVLRSLQSGIVTLFAGVAVMVFRPGGDPVLEDLFNLIAAVMIAVGLALLVSAGLSMMLSRRMGLLDAPHRRGPHDVESR